MSIRVAAGIRVAVSLLVVGGLFTLGLYLTFQVADTQKTNYFNQRKVQATTAAASIDKNDVKALTGTPADLGTDNYQRLRAQLVRIKESDSRVRYVYLMRPDGKKMVFLVDAEDPSSPDFSPPGQVYSEAKPVDFLAFQGKRGTGTWIEGPVRDRWGTWLSATAYVNDAAGKPVALLGTDVDVERALSSFNDVKRLGITFDTLGAVLMLLVAFQWIAWSYNRDRRRTLQREMEASALQLNRELVKADRMKSDFVQLASHELRGPVNAVNVAIQALDSAAAGKLDDDEKSLVRIAGNGSARLADLVDNLLDMSRIEAGDFVPKPAAADAAELLERTAQLFEPLAATKKIVLTANRPEEPVDSVLDTQMVLRVLENLVANAIKFTDYGGIVIELRPSGEKLLYSVQDTGAGIPDSFKDEIFKKFAKLDRPSREGTLGAGMGLALCKSMVGAQGGRIWFESEEGRGSTFYFEIPRYQNVH